MVRAARPCEAQHEEQKLKGINTLKLIYMPLLYLTPGASIIFMLY